jgi:hypothetical protein
MLNENFNFSAHPFKMTECDHILKTGKNKGQVCNAKSCKHSKRQAERRITRSVAKRDLLIIPQPVDVKTEDTGKCFEMAICLAYSVPFNGKFNYDIARPQKLASRLEKLTTLFPQCTHSKPGSRYDFISLDGEKYLSAKSTKRGVGKVAPQVIGQCSPQKFSETLGIPFTNNKALKQHIQGNIGSILPVLVHHTFDCSTIFYNEAADTIRYIEMIKKPEWNKYEFEWTCDFESWKNSSTCKIKTEEATLSLIEFQFHTKSRTNMAVRWCFENFLQVFKENLYCVNL